MKTSIALPALLCSLLLLAGCASEPARRADPFGGRSSLEEAAAEVDPSILLKNLEPAELIERGRAHLGAGNYRLSALYFSASLAKEPGNLEALLGLAEGAYRERRYADAETHLVRARELDRNDVRTLLLLGRTLRAGGRAEEAVVSHERAVLLHPEDGVAHEELGISFSAVGHTEEACRELAEAVRLRPSSASARNNLGFALLAAGRAEEAVGELKRARERDPASQRIRNNLAAALVYTGRWEEAYEIFVSTVGEAGALNNLGYFRWVKGERDAALKDWDLALERSPTHYVRAMENRERLFRADGTGGARP